jgi:hypothetical protein
MRNFSTLFLNSLQIYKKGGECELKLAHYNNLEGHNMGIYKNDYSKQEDEMLWELHEIRNRLAIKYKSMSCEEINKNAREKYETWKIDTTSLIGIQGKER